MITFERFEQLVDQYIGACEADCDSYACNAFCERKSAKAMERAKVECPQFEAAFEDYINSGPWIVEPLRAAYDRHVNRQEQLSPVY